MASWSDIPVELAGLFLSCLPAHVDRVRFTAVCPRWRAAAREVPLPPSLPLLALPDGTVYSLPGSEPFHLPACAGYTDASDNWLVFSGEDGCFLRDPFSNETVTLPALSRVRVKKVGDELGFAVERQNERNLSVERVKFCSPHLIAGCVTFGGAVRIAVCQPGAFSWWSVHVDDQSPIFLNITSHQGKLYALDHTVGALFSIDISIDYNTGDPWVSRVRQVISDSSGATNVIARDYAIYTRRFLVELHGRMLMVKRKMYHRWKIASSYIVVPPTWKNKFKVFKADLEQSRWSKVTTIGDDHVLFLRRHCCRFVCVSKYKMLGNRIFFLADGSEDGMGSGNVDDNQYSEERLGACRVFDLRDGKISDSQPSISWDNSTVLVTWLFPPGQE